MTAYEMRQRSEEMLEKIRAGLAADNNIGTATISAQIHTMQACWEIAAQIAELREEIRSA